MSKQLLAGGNIGGAVRVEDTVRRPVGPWTESVHALLHHLQQVGFGKAPRILVFDDQGREVLSYLPGNTVGDQRPWPTWVHSEDALVQVAHWLQDCHATVASFTPGHLARGRALGARPDRRPQRRRPRTTRYGTTEAPSPGSSTGTSHNRSVASRTSPSPPSRGFPCTPALSWRPRASAPSQTGLAAFSCSWPSTDGPDTSRAS